MAVERTQPHMPGPIFVQPWWLDAVAPDAWGEVKVEERDVLIARLPYMIKKWWGYTFLSMPPLTQTLGPWLRPYPGKYTNRLSDEKKLMTKLIGKLPPFDVFHQNFHYSNTNWLPFYWKGFQQTTRYTYVIEDLVDHEAIWDGFRENIRREIRKATKMVTIRDDLGLDIFLDLNQKVFWRQGKPLPDGREFIERLDSACAARNCRKIFFGEDAKGRVHAAVYIVWNEKSAYYLMGGGEPELRNSGATSLCMWEAIKFSSTVTRSFDFEGSMLESVERFFRAFGAKQKPYYQVSKFNSPLLKIAIGLLPWVKKKWPQSRKFWY